MKPSSSSQIALDAERLRRILPARPGVYMFKDEGGRVLYVGKAKDLRKRVISYFRGTGDPSRKTARMLKNASGLDYLITENEHEAFILESNLIKKHLPRYNIILRDDKQYPCLRLDMREPYPKLSIARRMKKDGALYFGPFSSAGSVRRTLKVIERVFQIRKCKTRGLPARKRPCLNHQMGQCLGPCTENVPPERYRAVLRQVRLFLEGRSGELIGSLRQEMARASGQLDFERAARLRDQIRALERTVAGQRVVSPRMKDQDVVGLAGGDRVVLVVVLFVRNGCLVGSREYRFRNPQGETVEVLEAFLKQYYAREEFIPSEVLIPETVQEQDALSAWLSQRAGRRVTLHRPLRGEKRKLLEMARSNAEDALKRHQGLLGEDLMEAARAVLGLQARPREMEGLDISNLQGSQAVGSVVSFTEGLPRKAGYRSYRIRAVEGIDDYGMMAELMERRLKRGGLPDLFVVDGGKGHLHAVKRVLDRKLGKAAPAVVSLAKADEARGEQEDKIYVPGRKNPLSLRSGHPVLLLLMRIRDEAHRRAITHHRKLRSGRVRASVLDGIPGVGPRRKKALLSFFKNVDALVDATPEDLARVPGIDRALARRIAEGLKGEVSRQEG
ncbi:MAG: excinuclease ABC subunit UvrC [Deltaproteobacteria bacterium]|nr:excinuclease ABC subunit UvrC [Deltaproteobacteria bacterium]MBW2008624.1 excinuclease ABC subunit UvrC [Deltaproteobacteria bacterium]